MSWTDTSRSTPTPTTRSDEFNVGCTAAKPTTRSRRPTTQTHVCSICMRRRCKGDDDLQRGSSGPDDVRKVDAGRDPRAASRPVTSWPLKFTAYDGSSAGPQSTPEVGLDLRTPRGTTYLATVAGRAGAGSRLRLGRRRDPHRGASLVIPTNSSARSADKHGHQSGRRHGSSPTSSGPSVSNTCGPIAPPPQEALPRWRRIAEGLRHSKSRDADAIHHHYDVSNTFYEYVLGSVDDLYLRDCYRDTAASLEEAQGEQVSAGLREAAVAAGVTACSTSAAAGAAWCAMPRAMA